MNPQKGEWAPEDAVYASYLWLSPEDWLLFRDYRLVKTILITGEGTRELYERLPPVER